MDIVKRLQTFNTKDFVCSYSAKFLVGYGLGLLSPEAWRAKGWLFILIALLIGIGPEIKFFKAGE